MSGVRKRGQMVDDRGQKIEIGSRNAEAKKELAEDRRLKSEVGMRRWEFDIRKSEVGKRTIDR